MGYQGKDSFVVRLNHITDSRIAACRRAYYMLQPVGLHPRGLAPETISYVWRTALQPILTYAVQCVGISKTKLKEMDRIQARLLKSSLSISKYCRNTSLLQAMKVQPVSTLSDIYTLDLLSSHMKNNANGRTFYSYLLSHTSGQFSSHDNLVNRCMSICHDNLVNRCMSICHDNLVNRCMSICHDNLVNRCMSICHDNLVNRCMSICHDNLVNRCMSICHDNLVNRCMSICHDNLVNRCMSICQSRDISLFKYLFLDDYVTSTKCIHKSFPINDGVIDCITYLLSDFTYENRVMLQSLLFPF